MAGFARLHRMAKGDKGRFMTERMQAFFADLEASAGAVVDFLGDPQSPAAAAFGFEHGDAYYLYNSAYDPAASPHSPGIVLVASLIDAAIRSGKKRFDFLKGDEMYKTRLGAGRRTLYELTARRGPSA